MEFLTDSKIPFLKYRKVFVWVSLALLIVAVVELFALGGLNFGIDFVGGTQLTVKVQDGIGSDDLRNALSAVGETVQIQQYGDADANELLIKTPIAADADEDSAAASTRLIGALNSAFNAEIDADTIDLNQRGTNDIRSLLMSADPDGLGSDLDLASREYEAMAEAIIAERREVGLFTDWSDFEAVDELSPAAVAALQQGGALGRFQVLSNENVGPQIGSELRTKGYLAVVMSLLGMLAYIWYRFELRFGVGALVAVFHDFLITLGLFALMNYEFTLATIAAFLTLVGYSVNDTVIIFDRVRENMRRFRRMPLEEVMNLSINQTLSRTILTSGTTLLVVGSLYFAGGEALRGFAFVLLIGIIIGTYSSVFVASPFALLWEQWFGHETKRRTKAKPAKV